MLVRRLSRVCWVLLALCGAPRMAHALDVISCPGAGTAIVNAVDAFYFLGVGTDTAIQILWTDPAGVTHAPLIPAGGRTFAVSVKAGTNVTFDCLGPGNATVGESSGIAGAVLCSQALNQTAFENTTGSSFTKLMFITNNSTVPFTVSYQDPSGRSDSGTVPPRSEFDLTYGIGPGGQINVVCPRILTEGAYLDMKPVHLP